MRYRSNTIVVWRSRVIINKQRVKMSTPRCESLELRFCIFIYIFRGINIRARVLTRLLVVQRNRLAPLLSSKPSSTPSLSNVKTTITFFFSKQERFEKWKYLDEAERYHEEGHDIAVICHGPSGTDIPSMLHTSFQPSSNVPLLLWPIQINDLRARKKLPIIVGGTNYYIESILWEVLIDKIQIGKDDQLGEENVSCSKKMKVEMDRSTTKSNEQLYEELVRVDPEMAKRFHPNNRRKIIR